MSETIHEQIAQWIAAAIDGKSDPAASVTLRAVRPKILDWNVEDYQHGDVIIEAEDLSTQSKRTTNSRTELGVWTCYGVIRKLPADTAADTFISRVIETIRRLLLAGNSGGMACGEIALTIDCPRAAFEIIEGGVVAEVTVHVVYMTDLYDGYSQ